MHAPCVWVSMMCLGHLVECWSREQQFCRICICRKCFRHMARWFQERFHWICIGGKYFGYVARWFKEQFHQVCIGGKCFGYVARWFKERFHRVCIRKCFGYVARWFKEQFHWVCISRKYFGLFLYLHLSCLTPCAAAILVRGGIRPLSGYLRLL